MTLYFDSRRYNGKCYTPTLCRSFSHIPKLLTYQNYFSDIILISVWFSHHQPKPCCLCSRAVSNIFECFQRCPERRDLRSPNIHNSNTWRDKWFISFHQPRSSVTCYLVNGNEVLPHLLPSVILRGKWAMIPKHWLISRREWKLYKCKAAESKWDIRGPYSTQTNYSRREQDIIFSRPSVSCHRLTGDDWLVFCFPATETEGRDRYPWRMSYCRQYLEYNYFSPLISGASELQLIE